jgi:LPS-assembly protein
MSVSPNETWHIRSNLQWNASTLDSLGGGLFYKPDHGPAFSLMYSHSLNPYSLYTESTQSNALPPRLHQTQTSLYWPLHPKWQITGHWTEDWHLQQAIEHTVGLTYKSCCFGLEFFLERKLKLVDIGRTRKYSHIIGIQFQLNGLGSVGNNVAQKLSSRIYGFKPL